MKQVVFGAMGLLVAMLSGCAEKYTIGPAQIALLNDELRTNTGVQKVLRMQTADGRIVELNPPVIVTIKMSDGRELQFCSPLRADFSGGFLRISHSCGGPANLNGADIDKVQVEEW